MRELFTKVKQENILALLRAAGLSHAIDLSSNNKNNFYFHLESYLPKPQIISLSDF